MLFYFASFTLPLRRIIFEKYNDNSIEGLMFHLQIIIPVVVIPALGLLFIKAKPQTNLMTGFRKLTSINIINIMGFASLAVCCLLTALQIPGWWWTWMTLGVHICTFMLIANILHQKVDSEHVAVIAAAATLFTMGLWEAMYHISYWKVYDRDIGISVEFMLKSVRFVLPWIVVPYVVLYFYSGWGLILRSSKYSLMYAGLFLLTFGTWIVSGMWVDIHYNWATFNWEYTRFDYVQMMLYKSSKILLALTVASLFVRSKNESAIRPSFNSRLVSSLLPNNSIPNNNVVKIPNSKRGTKAILQNTINSL